MHPNNTSILILFNHMDNLSDRSNAESFLSEVKLKLDEISDLRLGKTVLTNSMRNRFCYDEQGYCCSYDITYQYEIHLNNIIYKHQKTLVEQCDIIELRLAIINKINEIESISDLICNIYSNDSMISRSEDF